jgi:mannan endo-1,4-beta-mannosidase
MEYHSMQNAPDWNTVNAGNKYGWYIDYFLDAMKKASDQAGKRLLDVLDLHWYPEAAGDNRITEAGATTAKDRAARLQAPRSLWDNAYTENSWIVQMRPGPINLLNRVQASIDKYYPGTRIAITEYNYGEGAHVTGGLAEADFLGVMALKGVYASNFWPLSDKAAYVASAFRLYRNYDGQKGTYGKAAASAVSSDKATASVFASFNPGGDEVHIVAINKSPTETVKGTFAVASPVALAAAVKAYGFDQSATAVSAKAEGAVAEGASTYALPPWSATHFVLKTTGALPSVGLRPALIRPGMRTSAPAYLPDGRLFAPEAGRKAPAVPLLRGN